VREIVQSTKIRLIELHESLGIRKENIIVFQGLKVPIQLYLLFYVNINKAKRFALQLRESVYSIL